MKAVGKEKTTVILKKRISHRDGGDKASIDNVQLPGPQWICYRFPWRVKVKGKVIMTKK